MFDDQTFQLISFWICIAILIVYVGFGILKGTKEWFSPRPNVQNVQSQQQAPRETARFVSIPDSTQVGVGKPFDYRDYSLPAVGDFVLPGIDGTNGTNGTIITRDNLRTNLNRSGGYTGSSGSPKLPAVFGGGVGGVGSVDSTPQLLGDKNRLNEGVTSGGVSFGTPQVLGEKDRVKEGTVITDLRDGTRRVVRGGSSGFATPRVVRDGSSVPEPQIIRDGSSGSSGFVTRRVVGDGSSVPEPQIIRDGSSGSFGIPMPPPIPSTPQLLGDKDRVNEGVTTQYPLSGRIRRIL